MSGFSYSKENSSTELLNNNSVGSSPTKQSHNESTPILNGNGIVASDLKHSSSSSALINSRRLTRKLSEQKDFSYVSSPEEFVQKYCGNRVIKKVINKTI